MSTRVHARAYACLMEAPRSARIGDRGHRGTVMVGGLNKSQWRTDYDSEWRRSPINAASRSRSRPSLLVLSYDSRLIHSLPRRSSPARTLLFSRSLSSWRVHQPFHRTLRWTLLARQAGGIFPVVENRTGVRTRERTSARRWPTGVTPARSKRTWEQKRERDPLKWHRTTSEENRREIDSVVATTFQNRPAS